MCFPGDAGFVENVEKCSSRCLGEGCLEVNKGSVNGEVVLGVYVLDGLGDGVDCFYRAAVCFIAEVVLGEAVVIF